jgi:hypothetical protein
VVVGAGMGASGDVGASADVGAGEGAGVADTMGVSCVNYRRGNPAVGGTRSRMARLVWWLDRGGVAGPSIGVWRGQDGVMICRAELRAESGRGRGGEGEGRVRGGEGEGESSSTGIRTDFTHLTRHSRHSHSKPRARLHCTLIPPTAHPRPPGRPPTDRPLTAHRPPPDRPTAPPPPLLTSTRTHLLTGTPSPHLPTTTSQLPDILSTRPNSPPTLHLPRSPPPEEFLSVCLAKVYACLARTRGL